MNFVTACVEGLRHRAAKADSSLRSENFLPVQAHGKTRATVRSSLNEVRALRDELERTPSPIGLKPRVLNLAVDSLLRHSGAYRNPMLLEPNEKQTWMPA